MEIFGNFRKNKNFQKIKEICQLKKNTLISPENWFFSLDLGTTAPKTHQGVPETPRKPHKWKEHKILHRNCTQLFFSTPKNNLSDVDRKKMCKQK